MNDGRPAFVIRTIDEIIEIPPASWDACAGTDNPFVSHAFLAALEETGCVTPEFGWAPCHLLLEDNEGQLLGAVPMYLKGNSFGEFVFDHTWAQAYEQAGGSYYPKLLVAVPFTPVPGPRLLTLPERTDIQRTLISSCIEVAEKLGVSNLGINFVPETEWKLLGEKGFLLRTGEQFHWENKGYNTFDDFLLDLVSRKRKAIKRERREALNNGINIETISDTNITDEHWDAFYSFYLNTASRKWGAAYLNRAFFRRLHESIPRKIVLMMAHRGGRYIAGALNLIGRDTLYGRYWGCLEEHRFLHFELCYYQAIEFAIRYGLKRVEAGAQGPHKLARAYLPVHTYSAHWIRDDGFRRALQKYLERERKEVAGQISYLEHWSPFRRDAP